MEQAVRTLGEPGRETALPYLTASHSGKQRLKYYFDVSDTHEGRFSRPVPLWTVRPEYAPDIIEALENSFGELEQKDNLGAALLSAANNAVEDNIHDYLSELYHLTEGSFLEELDEYNVEVMYRRALQTSIGYMLVVRCGLDPSEYFEDDDFRDVLNFNTPETLNALGVATGDISQMCLSENCPARPLPCKDNLKKKIARLKPHSKIGIL